jgi:CRP-like cAMP-binding protein
MTPDSLAGIPLFADMADDELEATAALFSPTRVLMGEELTTVDDFGYSFFIVLEGTVRVARDDGAQVDLGAGDHFGEVALVTGGRRNATVKAMETCHLAKMMTWDFQTLMDSNPTLAERLKKVAEERA